MTLGPLFWLIMIIGLGLNMAALGKSEISEGFWGPIWSNIDTKMISIQVQIIGSRYPEKAIHSMKARRKREFPRGPSVDIRNIARSFVSHSGDRYDCPGYNLIQFVLEEICKWVRIACWHREFRVLWSAWPQFRSFPRVWKVCWRWSKSVAFPTARLGETVQIILKRDSEMIILRMDKQNCNVTIVNKRSPGSRYSAECDQRRDRSGWIDNLCRLEVISWDNSLGHLFIPLSLRELLASETFSRRNHRPSVGSPFSSSQFLPIGWVAGVRTGETRDRSDRVLKIRFQFLE